MKILFKDGVYKKESNDWIAENKVKTLGWRYSTRAEWKESVRDAKKQLVEALADKGKEAMTEVLSKHEKTKERRAKNHSKIVSKQTHQ